MPIFKYNSFIYKDHLTTTAYNTSKNPLQFPNTNFTTINSNKNYVIYDSVLDASAKSKFINNNIDECPPKGTCCISGSGSFVTEQYCLYQGGVWYEGEISCQITSPTQPPVTPLAFYGDVPH